MPSINQWKSMWVRLGVSAPPESLFHELLGRYSEPHRKYHTIRHLDECFEKLKEIENQAAHPEEIQLALWFHDAIYDVRRQDNEAKSADWARSAALEAGLPATAVERIHGLVLVTTHNAAPRAIDQQILVDADLSILGAKVERFDQYEEQIREEYDWVPVVVFRSKRRSILKDFLARSTIFNTQQFIDVYEAQARDNLERSIRKLEG